MEYYNYHICEEGWIISKTTGHPLAVHADKKGYCRVTLKHGDGGKTHLVHRLVAKKFVPNPNNYPQVNHLDGNKSNNHYQNLEWCTCQQNNDHAIAIGLVKRGKDRPNSKLSDEQVVKLRELREQGLTYYELGEIFNITYQSAHRVCTRQTYTHI